ncbi:MAG: biotin synthase, partial [Elusimicrobia bacterium]|nr:biotin synthase [Elusimicrobiota bacterium]
KTVWALNNLDKFPLEVNAADYGELLRVPGVGVTSARRILRARRAGALALDDLKKLGVVMKRAVYFVTAGGKYAGVKKESGEAIKIKLLEHKNPNGQLDLFGQGELVKEGLAATVTGQL